MEIVLKDLWIWWYVGLIEGVNLIVTNDVVALPPSSAARSQVDQGRRRGYHKMKLQNYLSATIKYTKKVNSTITAQL